MAAPYRNLIAWQRADDLFIEVHRITRQKFPSFEQFELAKQIRRSAYSVPANIAEGNSRTHNRDAARFFEIAMASLAETEYGLHAATRLGYLLPGEADRLQQMVGETARPLHGLSRSRRSPAPTS